MWNWVNSAVWYFLLSIAAFFCLGMTAAKAGTGAPRPVSLTGLTRLLQAPQPDSLPASSGLFHDSAGSPQAPATIPAEPDTQPEAPGRLREMAAWSGSHRRPLNDLLRFSDATLYTWTGPLRWEGSDWLKLGGTLAGSALLTLIDQPVRDFWQARDGKVWEAIETAGFHYGKPYAAFALTGGFYLSGLLFKSEWARETGLILGSTFLTSAAIQTIMKTAVGRARPGTNVGNRAFKPFSDLPDYHSFPSGHMQVALATALVLSRRVEHPLLKAFFYAAAGTTLISRMHSDAHWISDLAFGGAISWFCADAVIKRMEYNKLNTPFRKRSAISWDLAPSVSGISLTGRF